MIEEYRCVIKMEIAKYFIGVDYNGNKYSIVKNEHIKAKKGSDIYFYAKRKKGLFVDTLIPVSKEEGGYIY